MCISAYSFFQHSQNQTTTAECLKGRKLFGTVSGQKDAYKNRFQTERANLEWKFDAGIVKKKEGKTKKTNFPIYKFSNSIISFASFKIDVTLSAGRYLLKKLIMLSRQSIACTLAFLVNADGPKIYMRC